MLVVIATLLVAAIMAWRHATRLDRLSRKNSSVGLAEEQSAWAIVLGSLVAALGALTVLQILLLQQLQALGR